MDNTVRHQVPASATQSFHRQNSRFIVANDLRRFQNFVKGVVYRLYSLSEVALDNAKGALLP